jgi:hypothetical protein
MPGLNRPLSRFNRGIAILCVGLVLLLVLAAGSAGLHERLHGTQSQTAHSGPDHAKVGDPDHQCAATLFASGAGLLLLFWLPGPVRLPTGDETPHPGDRRAFARLRYWLVPAHAPPVG